MDLTEISVFEEIPFFSCLVAGVLLAMAFQAFFTVLSLATGLSLTPEISEKNVNKALSGNSDEEPTNEYYDDDDTSTVVKITEAVGAWTVVSVSLSLFFATFVAVKFSFLPDNSFGIPMGLVIWAAFYCLMLKVEWKMVSGLVGGVFNVAASGVKGSADSVSALFSSGETKKVEKMIEKSVKSLGDEIDKRVDFSSAENKLDEYVEKLEPKPTNYREMRKNLKKVIGDLTIDKQFAANSATVEKIYLNMASNKKKLSDNDKEELKSLYKEVTAEDSDKEKVKKAFDKLSPGSEEKGKETRAKIKQFLQELDDDNLNPEKFEADLEKVLNNPKQAGTIVQDRLEYVDKDTVIEAITKTTGMKRETVEQYSDKVMGILNSMQNSGKQTDGKSSSDSSDQDSSNPQEAEKLLDKAEASFGQFFNSIGRSEFDFDRIKEDVQRIFSDEYSTSQVLKRRMNEYDSESIKALLTTHTSLNEEQVEENTQKIIEARKQFIAKAEETERKVKETAERAKRIAIEKAEDAREAAIAASWILVLASVISAGAAALGGALAYTF